MDPITILSLVTTVAKLLPTLVNDATSVTTVLDQTSSAIKNAQAGDGTIAQADWDAIDATVNGDLSALKAQTTAAS